MDTDLELLALLASGTRITPCRNPTLAAAMSIVDLLLVDTNNAILDGLKYMPRVKIHATPPLSKMSAGRLLALSYLRNITKSRATRRSDEEICTCISSCSFLLYRFQLPLSRSQSNGIHTMNKSVSSLARLNITLLSEL